MPNKNRVSLAFLPYLMIGIITVCCFISAYGMTFLGDDLNHSLRTHAKFPHWYQWPLVIPWQWLTVNGRFGDMIGNVLLAEAPMWLLASLSALMEGLLYLMAVKIAFPDGKSVLPRLVTMAVILFAFPWWDSFFLFVCRINYVWSAALTLFVVWGVFFRNPERLPKAVRWLLPPLALVAAWSHEACGTPIAAGLAVYFLTVGRFRSLPLFGRLSVVAFFLGSLLSVTSPCSYSRLGSVSVPDDILPVLVLKSSFLALILILCVGVALCSSRGRDAVARLSRTPWTVLTVGAVCSMLFVAVGGIVGRSGFFSQLYALTALGILCRKLAGDGVSTSVCKKTAAIVLFLIMAAHEAGVCVYQLESNRDLKLCRELYEASADGVVFASPRQRDGFPWWTLSKNKACVDNDDYWLIEAYDRNIGKGIKHYRLLPKALEYGLYSERMPSGRGLSGWIETEKPMTKDGCNILEREGEEYTVVEFQDGSGTMLYYVAPRILDPGDR